MSILRLMLQTSIAGHHNNRGVHDVATDTSAETRKVEGKLDALVNLVTQLAVNQKLASVARVCGIRSSKDYHTNIFHDVATDIAAKTRKVEGNLDALVNLVTQLAVNQKLASVARYPEAYATWIYSRPPQQQRQTLDREDGCQLLAVSEQEMMPLSLEDLTTWLQIHLLKLESFNARNDAIVIRDVHDVATDTSAETRKVEGKLDALVNLVTQIAVNQKLASVARVCGIRSSKDYHTNRRWLQTPSSFIARNDAIVIRGVHDLATDIAAETRKVEGKLDALVNLVTQLAVNQKPASVARVCGIRSSNDHHTNVSRVDDIATDTSAETRMVEGKLDALLNLVTQLTVNQKSASVARVCGIRSSYDHHTNVCHHSSRGQTLDREDGFQLLAVSSARNDAIVIRGVHDVATDTSAETRKVEGKLDALVNLVTQLAVNQKLASVARVCGIRSSKDYHTNIFHDVATDIAAKTRKVEGKLDALVNLVTQLAVNQKLASVARYPEAYATWIYSSHHSREAGHLIEKMAANASSFRARNDAIVIRGFDDVATDTSAETRKVEGKLDGLVNLVTQLTVNQKSASVARKCGRQARCSCELGDSLAINQKPATVARVCHHSSRGQTLDREDGFQLLAVSVQEMMPLSLEEFTTWLQIHLLKLESARNDAIVIRGVHDVATDTSVETRKLEGKLDALVNLVTQLAASQKPTSVARVCGIRSSNDHHPNVCPSS
ncbi:hypothetical protein Fmac_024859 [Flemingia macrophylla]|uniref:Uncharacterized protein n=1 Tax=Flemingia macrophylla TaxID=520843 RepID=A0ABD1LQK5_9FABA